MEKITHGFSLRHTNASATAAPRQAAIFRLASVANSAFIEA
jgi:hypothetical protein